MFLVSKNGSSAVEINSVRLLLEYEDEAQAEANRIYNETVAKAYNFGSTERAKKEAERRVEDYLHDKTIAGRIFVNEKFYFGDYDEAQGKIVFEEIINAMKNESAYFDMREVELSEMD